jgi:methionine-rich copper-binding protein CopC
MSPMNRRVRWAVLSLVVAAFAASVEAHMALKKAEPADKSTLNAAPAAVTLWFTQKPDLTVSRVTLAGPAGEVTLGRLQAGDAMQLTAPVEGTMADGAYRVDWQAAGDDGHIQKGSVAFTLRRAQ